MSKVRMFRRLVSAVVLGLIGLLGLFSGVADRFAQATDWPQSFVARAVGKPDFCHGRA